MANNDLHEDEQRKPLVPTSSFHNDDDEYFKSFPPGFKFVPTDDELIVYYLKRKLQNLPLPRNKIIEINLYDYHPQTLAEQYKNKIQKNYLYFFTPRDKKYKNGTRPNRAAGNGYWKASGADKQVKHNGHVVGHRKSLVYYAGPPQNGQKTNWLMDEFTMKDSPKPRIGSNDMKLDDWVLCRVRAKNERKDAKNLENDSEYYLEANNEKDNSLMISDDSLLLDQHDSTLLNYSIPSTSSTSNNQLDSQDFGNVMMQPSWTINTTQENLFPSNNNDVLYAGIFDEIHPSSFSLPGPGKSLVYYVEKPQKSQKTNWLMDEFRMKDSPKPRIGSNDMKLDDWGLCRVQVKNERKVAKNLEEDMVGNESEDYLEANNENDKLMVADDSSLLGPTLLNYPIPSPISTYPPFNVGYNFESANNQLDFQDFGNPMVVDPC